MALYSVLTQEFANTSPHPHRGLQDIKVFVLDFIHCFPQSASAERLRDQKEAHWIQRMPFGTVGSQPQRHPNSGRDGTPSEWFHSLGPPCVSAFVFRVSGFSRLHQLPIRGIPPQPRFPFHVLGQVPHVFIWCPPWIDPLTPAPARPMVH